MSQDVAPAQGSSRLGDRRRLARDSSSILVATAVATLAVIGTSILTARVLGPDGRGQLTVATLAATLIVALGGLGLPSAAAYFTARDEWPRPVVLGNNVLLALALGAVALAVGSGVVVFGHATLHGLRSSYLLLALLAVPFGLVLANIQTFFLGLRRFREFNQITMGQALLSLVFIGAALLAFGGGVRSAILATLASTALVTVYFLIRATRSVGVVWTLDRRYIRAAPAYGLRAHAANVLGFLGYRLDVFILNAYTSFASVGLYTAAVAVAERLWLPSQAVSTALFPTIAEEKDESVRRAITPLLARNTLWLTAAVAAVVYVFAGPVVSLLYSSKFESSAGPLRTLLPGIVAYSGARVLGNDISARGRPLLNSYIASVSVTLNLVLNLVLIPRHGIVGAAWASTASYSVLFVSTIGLYCRIARVPVRAVIVPMREDATAYVRLARRLLARPAAQDPAGLGLASPLPLPDSESADS